MKIMIITLCDDGGMIHYVSQLAKALSKKAYVVVLAPVGINKKNFTKTVKPIELPLGHVMKTFFINTLLLTRPLKFLDTIKKEKPDIIHFNECHPWSSFFLPLLPDTPVVTTIHDVKPHIGTRKFDHIFGHYMHEKYSDCIIVHGMKAKKELKTSKKSFVIPPGDYSFF
jgi:alpha-maltose-1-phosphate synthase